ncbi:hypothetical protein JFH58_06135 [Enterococcus faecium]|nr:hypothetical protein [Enterococcus faecium]
MSEDLRELKLRKKQYDQYFSGLLNKHIEEGLDHDFGKDEYCLYCERYNEKMSEYLQLKKEIQKLEKKVHAWKYKDSMSGYVESQNKPRKKKQAYVLKMVKGEELIVLAYSEEEVRELVETPVRKKVETINEIDDSQYNSIYIETSHGGYKKLATFLRSSKVGIISKKDISAVTDSFCTLSVPKAYFQYDSKRFERLEKFCRPYTVLKTKKFNKTKRVSIQLPTGQISLGEKDYLIKVGKELIIKVPEHLFKENFEIRETLVWKEEK